MSLKFQLAIVAAISLLLPWAGCEYVQETELALRENQQQLLRSAASNIATSLSETMPRASEHADAVYFQSLTREPLLDGYPADWPVGSRRLPAQSGPDSVVLRTAQTASNLYVFVGAGGRAIQSIRLVNAATTEDRREFEFLVEAPGELLARDVLKDESVPAVRGFLQVTNGGVNLEARLPLRFATAEFGVLVFDQQGNTVGASFESGRAPAPILQDYALTDKISRFQQPGTRIHVIDSGGWIRASTGRLLRVDADGASPDSLLGTRLFRRIIDRAGDDTRIRPAVGGKDQNVYVTGALQGSVESAWLTTNDETDSNALVVAAAPVMRNGVVLGAAVLTQTSAARLLLTNQAMSRLALLTLSATLGTALLLLAFAGWLSFRVRRLSQAADSALGWRGEINTDLPSLAASDEIGSLARSFSTLLSRVGEYNAYLRALAGRLSHELNTPLSVVSSSLDNLDAETPAGADRAYLERAREGVERLRSLVRAMSEATRVEEAASDATQLEFDLRALVSNAVAGYESAYPDSRFVLPPGPAAPVRGAPNLILQLLDKLISNAVSFAKPETDIALVLRLEPGEVFLEVRNSGPLLPAEGETQIFESLVSYRATERRAHMGFGLYIARLIADAHRGRISAQNHADASGVCFTFSLPALQRENPDAKD